MNDYEQERLANIAKNEALLKEIGLTGIKPPKPRTSTPLKKATPRRKSESPSVSVPRRTSSRLSGIPADSEVAKRKAEAQLEEQCAIERQKRMRVKGPVALQDVLQSKSTWADVKGIFRDVLSQQKTENSRLVKEEDDAEADAKELVGDTTESTSQLRRSMENLSLLSKWEPNAVKLTPERIFSIAMHPGHKKLVVAGDKLGHLGIWDVDGSNMTSIKDEENDDEGDEQADSLGVEDPAIHHFKLHSRTITATAFSIINPALLFTSSYDGSVRALDLTSSSGEATEIFTSDTDQAITGLQLQPDGSLVYFSTLEGEVGFRDMRVPLKQSKCEIYQLHDRKIGALGLHPLRPHMLVTSSLDRTMKVWDFRKMTGGRRNPPTPTLLAEHTASLSVSSAFFNAKGSVVATSYDNTLKVFHLDHLTSTGKDPIVVEPDVSVKHNNTTGRWLTVFKAAWQQTPADGIQKFVVGNMNRAVDVFGEQGQVLAQLRNEYISAVPAVVAMHPSHNWVIAGNASGKGLFFS